MSPDHRSRRRHDRWPFGWIGSPWFTLLALTLALGWHAWGLAYGSVPWAATAPALALAGVWWQDGLRLRGLRMYELPEKPIRWLPTAVLYAMVAPVLVLLALVTGEAAYWRQLAHPLVLAWTAVAALLIGVRLSPGGRARMLDGVRREREYEQERQRHWESDHEWEERLARRAGGR